MLAELPHSLLADWMPDWCSWPAVVTTLFGLVVLSWLAFRNDNDPTLPKQ